MVNQGNEVDSETTSKKVIFRISNKKHAKYKLSEAST